MNNDNVDKFLLQNKAEVKDNGFSEAVMSSLPVRCNWQIRLNRIWQCICLTAAVVFCYATDVLDNVMTDIHVFINTLSFETALTQWLYALALPTLFIFTSLVLVTRKAINA